MKEKTIALVDGNNFFASCEILMNPVLKGKPVCVLSNNDGCVIARSYEAKKLGVKMGMPYFMAKRDFPKVVYLSSNFALYHDISMRMMQILRKYTDKLDIYSIDEAFLDITGCDKIFKMSFSELAKTIRKDVETNLGLSVSVGIANSKILAKAAAQKAKDKQIFSYVIEKHLIKNEISNIPVEEIWGIGRNIARNLRAYGIFYADEILLKEEAFFKQKFGKKGLELKYELSGESVIPLTGVVEKPKSLQRTRAFPEFSSDKKYILAELELHLHNVCKKLRENSQKTNLIGVMLRTKDFRVLYIDKAFDFYTDSEIKLTKYVKELFTNIYQSGIIYRSSGVYVLNLKDACEMQINLFESINSKRQENLATVIDKIENKYGKGSISTGVTGIKTVMAKHKCQANLKNHF